MSNDTSTKKLEIMRFKDGQLVVEKDQVVLEYPLTIFLNDQELVTLLCSPCELNYLALGFLRSEGLLSGGMEDLESARLDEERGIFFVNTKDKNNLAEKLYGKRTITSGCGKGTVFFHALDSLQQKAVTSKTIFQGKSLFALMRSMQNISTLYKITGGVHSVALADQEKIVIYSEDIGRHNALDKIVGKCLIDNIPLQDKILLSSGRLSAEVVLKGAKMGLPLIVSRSAPTTLAVELAAKVGVTLIGFLRGRRFNIYTGAERIV